ncbi:RNA-directed DNA polymerase, eukaryota [Tanacetum coccineum]
MGRFISKEDDVAKISTSIFVTNFPEACSAKELFTACKQYGHVVDSFIPIKRSKTCKRFGFVRFINVFNEERLVNNLCTVWIDRFKLQANIARFHKPPVNGNNLHEKKIVGTTNSNLHRNEGVNSKSFASALNSHAPVHINLDPPSPAIVLDDVCLKESDLSCSLIGKLKKFQVIPNIHVMLENEGFPNVNVTYMGGMWVLLTFDDEGTREKLLNHKGVNSEYVLMGDFNEVRSEQERFGTLFNANAAKAFNTFIAQANLIDLPLEGYSFTWSYTSASKMSKLDRFLVSEGLHYMFPSLSALCLEKNLSDHRPILMRELNSNYGPTPFRIFHSWFSLEGFDNLVRESWSKPVHDEKNSSIYDTKSSIQNKLSNLDKTIDQGMCQEETLAERTKLQHHLYDLNSLISQDMAQKAKIRWAIEGDENSKFLHGMINKKRSQLAIRGVLVDGEWISETTKVDFEKAFDSIRWDYLDEVLLNFGFSCKWRGWIKGCLSSSLGSVLVNGCPTTEFKFFKGINLNESLTLSHFFYADDAVFVGKWEVSNISVIVNARIMGVGVSKEEVESAARYVGCSTFSTPFTYLGITVVTFGVVNNMEAIRRNFLNGVDKNDRKIHWIAWKKVLAAKKNGGLGKNRLWRDYLFWKDSWHSVCSPHEFSMGFCFLEIVKDATVAGKFSDSSFSSTFRRYPRGGAEQFQFDKMCSSLDAVILSHSRDKWTWSLNVVVVVKVVEIVVVEENHVVKYYIVRLRIVTWYIGYQTKQIGVVTNIEFVDKYVMGFDEDHEF